VVAQYRRQAQKVRAAMHHDIQAGLIRRILAHMEAGTTDRGDAAVSPVARYLSPARVEREKRLLRRMPAMVCASSHVARPGDWFAHDLSGVPILVARGQDGVLRAFINACRHRGARLVETGAADAAASCGAGRRNFVCPYHSWTYDLDGSLRGLPHPEEFPDLDRAAHHLVALPVAEAAGLVWVVPTPSVEIDIRASLGPMLDDLESSGHQNFVAYHQRRFETAHDWKLMADANLEAYHFQYLHRDTIAALFQDNRMVADHFGDHMRITLPKRSIETLRGQPEAQWNLAEHCNIIYYFFPATMFLCIGDHATVSTAWPRAVGASVIDSITLVPPLPEAEPALSKARAHWDKNVDIFWDALLEDYRLMDSMQSTMASGANQALSFGRSEYCSALFEEAVERHLAVLPA
jgi:phenylpropionate dioxygenase-like ring-hydroxylating dioxygenase large terminal subunit